MPRESTIQIFRSNTSATPTGLTFGELAFSDVAGAQRLFVGGSGGSTIWIGAGVTDGTLVTNSSTLVPTQSAVKTYVDGIVGGGSAVVNTFNGTGGAVTMTGDGGAIVNTQSGKANTVGIRLASTSVTGAASFDSGNFAVSAAGAVTIKAGGVTNGSLANSSVTVSPGIGLAGGGAVSLGETITLNNVGVTSVAAGVGIVVSSATGAVTISNNGVTSVNGLTGAVSNIAVTNAAQTFSGLQTFTNGLSSGSVITVNNAVQGLTNTNAVVLRTAANAANAITIGATGNNTTISSGSGITRLTTGYGSGTWANFGAQRARLALQGNDGEGAVFDVTIDPSSALTANRTLTCPNASGTIALTNSVVVSAVAGAGIAVSSATGAVTITNIGVTSFNGSTGAVTFSNFVGSNVAGPGIAVSSATGAVTISNVGVTSVNGLTGAVSNIAVLSTNTFAGLQTMNAGLTATNIYASSGVTFDTTSAHNGLATFSGGVTANNLFVSGGATFNGNISAPNIVTSINGFTAGVTITGSSNVTVTNSANTATISLPNDITISGNLTVNGTVVTANVDTFIVEDPMFMLGTGNAADSVDLGFYSQYTSGGRRFTGLFRDATDGKYRLFTGLSGDAEPSTTVNISGTGFAITTLIANIDGGTF